MPTPITITSISRTSVDNVGGMFVSIFGDFTDQFGFEYNVHVGPLGTTADPKALSGKAGQGTGLYVWTSQELRCYMPRLTAGSPVSLLIRRVDGSREQLVSNALQVLPAQYPNSVFDIRSVFPPHYAVGPRKLEMVDPV